MAGRQTRRRFLSVQEVARLFEETDSEDSDIDIIQSEDENQVQNIEEIRGQMQSDYSDTADELGDTGGVQDSGCDLRDKNNNAWTTNA